MGKEIYDPDCKTVVFSSKSVKKSVKRGVSVKYARSARASHARSACEAREKNPVFSLVPDLLFDCSRVLEYPKIRLVPSRYLCVLGVREDWGLG